MSSASYTLLRAFCMLPAPLDLEGTVTSIQERNESVLHHSFIFVPVCSILPLAGMLISTLPMYCKANHFVKINQQTQMVSNASQHRQAYPEELQSKWRRSIAKCCQSHKVSTKPTCKTLSITIIVFIACAKSIQKAVQTRTNSKYVCIMQHGQTFLSICLCCKHTGILTQNWAE